MREGARIEALGIQIHIAKDQGHQAVAVGRVVDGEARLQADLGRLPAQDAHTGRVEGQHPHRLRAGANEPFDSLTHLRRRLVSEGNGEDLSGLDATVAEQIGDAVREHAGLARARAGDDQQWRPVVDDRLALLGVQAPEQALDIDLPVCRRPACRSPVAFRHNSTAVGARGTLGGHRPRGDAGLGDIGRPLGQLVEQGAHLGHQPYVGPLTGWSFGPCAQRRACRSSTSVGPTC